MTQQLALTVNHTTATELMSLSDQTLLQRLAQGDTSAFWELWESYRHELLSRYCLRWMGGNLEEAEDALSNAGLKALDYLLTHDVEIHNVKHWLQRIVYNHCMNAWRRHRKWVDLPADMDAASLTGQLAVAPMWTSPEQAALRSELRCALQDAIDHLPSRLREPARLRFLAEMSHRDIALKLNFSPDNVRKCIQHARPLLQTYLQTYCSDALQPQADTLHVPITPSSYRNAKAVVAPPASAEISVHYVALRLLRIKTTDGIDHHVPVGLDALPNRQHQKLASLRAYVERHPTGWKKHLALADLLYMTGDWEAAIPSYRHVVNKQLGCFRAWLQLGRMLQNLQRHQDAHAVYQQALPAAHQVATQHHLQGLSFACQQNHHDAATAFEAARELQPDNIAHSHALGFTRLQANQPELALPAYDTVLAYHPDDPVALTYSYDALSALGQWTEAQPRLERALEIDPKNVLAIQRQVASCLHRSLLNDEDGRDTKALLRRARHLAPQVPELQVLLVSATTRKSSPVARLKL